MQERATFKTVSRGGIQLLLLAAVLAAGVSLGRWVVPEASDSAASIIGAAAVDTLDPWAVDGPAAVDPALYRQGADAPSLIERKLSEMDRLDAWAVDGPAAVDPAITIAAAALDPWAVDGPAAVDPAIVTAVSLNDRSPAQKDPWAVDGPAAVDPAIVAAAILNDGSPALTNPWTLDGPAAVDSAIYAP